MQQYIMVCNMDYDNYNDILNQPHCIITDQTIMQRMEIKISQLLYYIHMYVYEHTYYVLTCMLTLTHVV